MAGTGEDRQHIGHNRSQIVDVLRIGTKDAFSNLDEVIEAAGVGDAARASLAAAIEDRLRRRAAGACDIAAVVFDAERRELFRTSGADAVIGKLGATYE